VLTQRQIFWPEALKRYTRSHERSVLPRFVRPNVTRAAWLLGFLIMAGGAAATAVRVPEFVRAPAVVTMDAAGRPVLLIFISPALAHEVAPGASVVARYAGGGSGWTVREVKRSASSPAAAAAEIGAAVLPDAARRGPTVLARALPAFGSTAPAADAPGTLVEATIRTGEQRAIALLRSGRGRR
jgi:hypothetical protein